MENQPSLAPLIKSPTGIEGLPAGRVVGNLSDTYQVLRLLGSK